MSLEHIPAGENGLEGADVYSTYRENMLAGKQLLEVALENETVFGADIAAESYRQAGKHLMVAMTTCPIELSSEPGSEFSPLLQLCYGITLTRQLQADAIEPYKGTHPLSRGRDHKYDVQECAHRSFVSGFKRMEELENDEVLVAGAKVVAAELEDLRDRRAAKLVHAAAQRALADRHAHSQQLAELVEFAQLDRQAQHEQASEALHDLITGTYEVVALAA